MGFLQRLFGGGEKPERQLSLQTITFDKQRPDAELEIVGELQYQAGIDRMLVGAAEPMALLMPEPDNRYDRNAIAVYMRADSGHAEQVGYLSRANAIAYGPVLSHVTPRHIYARAFVKGGRTGPAGVWLHLGSPAELMAELLLSEQTPAAEHPARGRVVCFTGTSRFTIHGVQLDKAGQEYLAIKAGCSTWPRVTKQVQLCVCADPNDVTGNLRKAEEYGIEVVDEARFWPRLGYRLD